VSIGDIEIPYLDVNPGDGTTGGTLTVIQPEGEPLAPSVTAGTPSSGAVRLTATAVTYDQPGRWVLSWVVTGTGAGAEDLVVYVVPQPTAGGPTWLPGRSRVANYVPQRTLARNPASYTEAGDTYAFTFNSTTKPNGAQTDQLISDGAAWVSTRVASLNANLTDAASVIVALYAAAAVERGWPHDDNSLQRANDLEKRLDRMLTDLVRANDDANGEEDPDVPQTNPMPVWAFPTPVPWGDSYL
jgi:hypothetical protein